MTVGEILEERRILSADLERKQPVAVKELAYPGANRPLAFSCWIIGQTEPRGDHVIVVIPKGAVWTCLSPKRSDGGAWVLPY